MATEGKKVLKDYCHPELVEGSQCRIKVKRYLPEKSEPFYQTYELKFHDEMTVLDALNKIKDRQDGSLSYRYSCRMGICGSCSAIVNGKPVIMCQTYLRDVKKPVKVEPMRNFPVIKDLVCDIDDGFEKMRGVNPYIRRMVEIEYASERRAHGASAQADRASGSASAREAELIKSGEHLQTPAQLEKLKQTSQCIKCMLCYSACPVYGFDKDFTGPAAGAIAYRYMADSREGKESKSARMDVLTDEKGVWKCSFIGECSAACPRRVDPALALQRLKLMGALHLAKSAVKKS